ncbi:MAG: TlpA family protein disulfide reductase [Chromatiaceae bacterium]|nr:TlpA family protein disulfide reductase [Chromatiaceae bacterium]
MGAGTAQSAAPELLLVDLEGVQHGLSEWRGQVLVVNFWASWCAPCQAEIPQLVRLQSEFGARGLQIIGVGIDAPRRLANVRRSLGINYPVLIVEPEQAGRMLGDWGNARQFVPYTVVIDRDGRVAHRQFGELDREVFNEFIAPLL